MSAKTREDFLRESIEQKLAGNAACGVGDPYPHDVACRVAYEAYIALGGTPEEARAEWERVYAVTAWHDGGGVGR